MTVKSKQQLPAPLVRCIRRAFEWASRPHPVIDIDIQLSEQDRAHLRAQAKKWGAK